MLLKSIQFKNFLGFGDEHPEIELGPLNVLIGPNGSGKSNLLESIALLRGAPRDLSIPIRDGGGGVDDWLWKGGTTSPVASVNAVISYPKKSGIDLRYVLDFTASSHNKLEIVDERIENERPYEEKETAHFYYKFQNGNPVINTVEQKTRQLRREDIDPMKSILAQRKDPEAYPELTWLANTLERIRLYREWGFGRSTTPRMRQKSDLPNDYLAEDAGNLGLVLNQMRDNSTAMKQSLEYLRKLYEDIDDFYVRINGGTVQVVLKERGFSMPATRLSDGTLRYLCLLAILHDPTPGPLVCIEEPELGMHPDILPKIADLLKSASERTQIIVTTHSDILVDAMTDTPESILVAERKASGDRISRLDADRLKPWLKEYRLGELWTSGEIGGNRW